MSTEKKEGLVINLDDCLVRQSSLIPTEILHAPITIVGAGAIGSWTALMLHKMGMTDTTIFDFDDVEIENMNSQFYSLRNIGSSKTASLKNNIINFTGIEPKINNSRFTAIPEHTKILISAVDNMETRKQAWNLAKNNKNLGLFIDPRMAIEFALMYAIDPNSEKDITTYENTLYSDAEAVQERCTAKSTVYTANLIAAQVCKVVKDYLLGNPYVRILQWDIANNIMKSYPNRVNKKRK